MVVYTPVDKGWRRQLGRQLFGRYGRRLVSTVYSRDPAPVLNLACLLYMDVCSVAWRCFDRVFLAQQLAGRLTVEEEGFRRSVCVRLYAGGGDTRFVLDMFDPAVRVGWAVRISDSPLGSVTQLRRIDLSETTHRLFWCLKGGCDDDSEDG